MTTLLKILLALICLGIALIGAGLALNRLPWSQPPGAMQRLITYLTTNVAETRPDHPFPELRARRYPVEPMPLYLAVNQAIASLGWDVSRRNAEAGTLGAVVTTKLLRFKDDVAVRLVGEAGGTWVEVRSASRIGQGDMGANTRHVMEFYQALEDALEQEGT